MIELTHRNHYQYTYNNTPFVYRTSTHQRFGFNVGKCAGPAGSWDFECERAARLIYSKARPGQKIKIFYSGGIDSEIVVMAFQRAGIPFECVIVDMGVNHHDTEYAYRYCQSNKIPYKIHFIDPAKFVADGLHFVYHESYQVKQLAMMIIMQVLDQLPDDDIYILGGEIFMSREVDLKQFYTSNESQYSYKWYHYVREDNDMSYFKYAITNNKTVISEFFSYTPELMLSYLTDPMVVDLVNDRIDYKYGLLSTKPNVYAKYWNFDARPKYHGYENVMHLNNKVYLDLGEDNEVLHSSIYKTEYTNLIKQLQHD
jgi:hypothetical protein